MGADIHVVIEAKLDDKWIGVWTDEIVSKVHTDLDPNRRLRWERPELVERHYVFFGMLAGVRNSDFTDAFESGVASRGIPDDASDLTVLCTIGVDTVTGYHSFGCCSLTDFCEIKANALTHIREDGIRPQGVEELREWFDCQGAVDTMMTLNEQDLEFRVVFWFDS